MQVCSVSQHKGNVIMLYELTHEEEANIMGGVMFSHPVVNPYRASGGLTSGQIAAMIGVAAAAVVVTGGIGAVGIAAMGFGAEGAMLGGAAGASGAALGAVAGALGFSD